MPVLPYILNKEYFCHPKQSKNLPGMRWILKQQKLFKSGVRTQRNELKVTVENVLITLKSGRNPSPSDLRIRASRFRVQQLRIVVARICKSDDNTCSTKRKITKTGKLIIENCFS